MAYSSDSGVPKGRRGRSPRRVAQEGAAIQSFADIFFQLSTRRLMPTYHSRGYCPDNYLRLGLYPHHMSPNGAALFAGHSLTVSMAEDVKYVRVKSSSFYTI